MPYTKTEKEETDIKITPISKKITENIEILPKILTSLEMDVINILDSFPALTTNEVRNHYVLLQYAEYDELLIPKEIKLSNKEKEKLEKIGKQLKNSKTEKERFQILQNVNLTLNFKKSMERVLKFKGIRIPSYEKFDNVLLGLEKLGIVARRYDPLRLGKWLWVLSPQFLIARKRK